LVDKDRDYLFAEITNLHNALLAQQTDRDSEITSLHSELLGQQTDRDALEDSNTKLRGTISELEEKLRQWEAENFLTTIQEHAEEMEVLAAAYQQARDDCERLK